MKTYLKRKTAFLISPRELVYKLPGTPGGQPSGQESVEAAKLRPGGHTDNAEEMGQILTIGVSGTNKELESKLAAERTRFPEGNPYPIDEEFTSEKARPLASKIGAVVALGHQISIGQDGADVTFDFVHNGESINLTYQEGEGVYLAITVGEKG